MTARETGFLEPEAAARVRLAYRTPSYFEWRVSGTAFAIRGIPVVYILGFKNGLVKVGQTNDFLTRLSGNRSHPLVQKAGIHCGWRVGSDYPMADEQRLIGLALSLGGIPVPRKREWFERIAVADLISAAERELVAATP